MTGREAPAPLGPGRARPTRARSRPCGGGWVALSRRRGEPNAHIHRDAPRRDAPRPRSPQRSPPRRRDCLGAPDRRLGGRLVAGPPPGRRARPPPPPPSPPPPLQPPAPPHLGP